MHSTHEPPPQNCTCPDMGGGMVMYLHTGFNEYILFKDWETKSVGAMVGACIGWFIIAVLFEVLKMYRERLVARTTHSDSQALLVNNAEVRKPTLKMTGTHVANSLLYGFQFLIGYLMMLIFMTYNIWLCLSLVLGVTSGYFLVGWRRTLITQEFDGCCH